MNEIERKYLAAVDKAPLRTEALDKYLAVEQGYLMARPSMEWRIRRTHYRIPDKGVRYHTAFKFGNGYVRKEYEWRIPGWLFQVLRLGTPRVLHKIRLSVGGWDIDLFTGRFAGLCLAEYEVPTQESPAPPVPDCLTLLRDVTEERTYANKNLSRLDDAAAERLAKAAGEVQ